MTQKNEPGQIIILNGVPGIAIEIRLFFVRTSTEQLLIIGQSLYALQIKPDGL